MSRDARLKKGDYVRHLKGRKRIGRIHHVGLYGASLRKVYVCWDDGTKGWFSRLNLEKQ